jgi:hypothetical protein
LNGCKDNQDFLFKHSFLKLGITKLKINPVYPHIRLILFKGLSLHSLKFRIGEIMTELLKQAFTQASNFSEVEQNLLAKWILAEMDSEQRWNRAFARSEDLLSQLADEALAEHKAGKTKINCPNNVTSHQVGWALCCPPF